MAIIFDEQGNLVDTENRVQFGNENFDSEPYQYTPNYLGANSPMLDEGDATLSSITNYGYDPAFGQLESQLYGDTSYPGSGKTYNYADFMGEVPSLQRGLGDERFALAPEQPQGIAFNNPVGGLDQYAREMEALEAARGGQEVSVNELGGTLQDFYTNRNPGTNANTKFEVIDDDINFNTQPQELGFIESAPQPKEAIYQDRIMNNNLSNSNYEPQQGIMQNLQNKMGGLRDFLPGGDKSLSGMAVKGIKGLFEKLGNGADYQQYDPNVDYSKFNPNMEINDFYDPRTKTNRFQRAKPGSFASFRTGADYFKARREKKAAAKAQQEQIAAAKAQKEQIAREASTAARARAANASVYSNAGVGSGGFASQNTGSNSNFSNKTGRGRTGFQEGGLASMFTRRR